MRKDKKAIIPNKPRNLIQAGQTKYSIVLFWQISDNVQPSQIASHTFSVTKVEGGQVIPVPATHNQPDQNGGYLAEIGVDGGTQPVSYNVQVRAQALNGEYGPFSDVLECKTAAG